MIDSERHVLVQAQPDVLGHGEGIEQAEMLEHHADARCARFLRVTHTHGSAVKLHAAGIRLHRTMDDFHQRRFAGAVLTQHGVGLARLHQQRHVAIGHQRRIALGDVRE
jgi:hypothetical protein